MVKFYVYQFYAYLCKVDIPKQFAPDKAMLDAGRISASPMGKACVHG